MALTRIHTRDGAMVDFDFDVDGDAIATAIGKAAPGPQSSRP